MSKIKDITNSLKRIETESYLIIVVFLHDM